MYQQERAQEVRVVTLQVQPAQQPGTIQQQPIGMAFSHKKHTFTRTLPTCAQANMGVNQT